MIDFVVFLDLYFDLVDCGISCLVVVGWFVVLILGFDLVVMMACSWFVIVLFWITSGLFCFEFGWFVNSVVWFFLVCFICVLLCVRCVLVSVRCLSFCVGFDCCRFWCVCVYWCALMFGDDCCRLCCVCSWLLRYVKGFVFFGLLFIACVYYCVILILCSLVCWIWSGVSFVYVVCLLFCLGIAV